MRTAIVIAATLSLLLISSVAFAQESCKTTALCNETTELSAEQSAKLTELQRELQMESIKISAELKILELKISQELSKDDPNARELETLVSKVAGAKQNLHKMRIDLLLKANKILEPEQWNKFRMCFESMADPCSGRMGCAEIDRCKVNCDKPMRVVVSGKGKCGPAACVSTDSSCGTTCASKAACCCCDTATSEMKNCSPSEGSCRTVERRCVQVQAE